MERKVYIENNDTEQALSEYLSCFSLGGSMEMVPVDDSINRVTYEAVFAAVSDPSYNAAAMDGIMLNAAATFGASERTPLTLYEHKDFEYVNTGGAVPSVYNAVIMIEDVIGVTDESGNQGIQIIAPAHPWQHIRTVGESLVCGEMILPQKHKIRPVDVGALVAGGHKQVKVYKKPRVAIIATGAELVDEPSELGTGKLMESNSHVFAGLVKEYGGEPVRSPIVRDDYNILLETIKTAAAENDIITLNAGTSAGTKDYTLKAIKELGEILCHGMAVKPGKPTILGRIGSKPVIGIPGYPVSAFLMFEMFVKPLVLRSVGLGEEQPDTVSALLTRRVVKSVKNKELLRMALGFVDNRLVATPLERGAAAVMSLVKADGIVQIEQNTEGLEAGETVNVKLLKSLSQIKETLTVIGSHDLLIDLIANRMRLSSAHVGSFGGITALLRNECHIAPIHLLDEATGEYNESYIKKYFPGQKMALIKGVERTQGFIVPKGNPKGITGFGSLVKEGVTYANRQKGAGTRILLDFYLKKEGIEPEKIVGYEKELTTHMAVAIAVKSGTCDCGLGIYSAAAAMDLDFVELCGESYDFVTYERNLEDVRIKEFIRIIQSDELKQEILTLGGYTCGGIGEVSIICATATEEK